MEQKPFEADITAYIFSCHHYHSRKILRSFIRLWSTVNSRLNMAWVKHTCGRIKSDYRYSKDIVYNNYPWPENPSEKQNKAVKKASQSGLDARAQFPDSSLADLYDQLTLPLALIKAHQELDKAVDLCYRPKAFVSEAKRMEFLFELYENYTAGLFLKENKKRLGA